jgi:excisionase family DNA binding protein
MPARNLRTTGRWNPHVDLTSQATIPSWAAESFDLREPSHPVPSGLTPGGAPHPANTSPARAGPVCAPLLTVVEAAWALRVSTKTIRRMLARGELHRVRVGRLARIRAEDIAQYIGERTSA